MAYILERKIKNKTYYYLGEKIDGKVKTTYLGKHMPIRRWRGWTNLDQETIDWLKKRASIKTMSTRIITANGKYRTIVVDPPWPIKTIDLKARAKEGTQVYPTMTLSQIKNDRKRLPIRKLADKSGCFVFLWTTQKYIEPAIKILTAWGFKHIFTMVWHKNAGMQPFNLPQYNCEFVLFGRKGKIQFLETKEFKTCFYAQRREHSRKPDEFYELVRRVCPAPRLDMFSREARDGFDQYGNEVRKYGNTETNPS